MANTTTKVDLVINRMSQSKYEQLKADGQLDPNQIYMTTDGIDPIPDTRKVNGKTLDADVTLTGADIAVSTSDATKIDAALAGKAASSHAHGNITTAGALQTTDISIANGDKLVVTDASDSNKVARTSVAFDGSTTTQYLSKKGTWQSLPTASTSASGVVQLNDTLTSNSTTLAATANAVKQLNDKLSDYVLLSDLEDGIRTSDIQASSITVNGKAPSLEGHTHSVEDIEGLDGIEAALDEIIGNGKPPMDYGYLFVDTVPEDVSGVQTITLRNYCTQTYVCDPTDPDYVQTFTVAPPSGITERARDMVFILDCRSITQASDLPKVTWTSAFHPRTATATDMIAESGAKNVFYVSEYSSGQFVVGKWTETAGGYSPQV